MSSQRVTLKDVARELGISHATVSRSLNHSQDFLISETTRQKVRVAALKMGYRPNHAGRTLATGKTGLVALWLWSEGSQGAYQALVSRHMYAEASQRSQQLIVDLVGEKNLDRIHFDRWNVDGIIAHESCLAIEAELNGSVRPPIPIVATGSYNLLQGVDRVMIDLSHGAQEAVSHLILTGRRSICYLTQDPAGNRLDPRSKAYHSGLAASGMEPWVLQVSSERAHARSFVRELFQRTQRPDALFCHNDDIAIGAYRGLCDLGIRPPEVAITGCDGIEDTEYLEVPISTVALPIAQMCAVACKLLQQRMENPSAPLQESVLEAEFLPRPSSSPH